MLGCRCFATHFGHNGVCVCVTDDDDENKQLIPPKFCLSKWLWTLYLFSPTHTHSGPQRIFVSKVSIIHKFVRQERPWQFIEIDWVCVYVCGSRQAMATFFKTLVSELFKLIHVFVHSDQREFFFLLPKKRNIKSRNTQNKRCAWYLMWHQGQGKTTMTTTTTWMVTIRTKQCDANTFSRNSQQSRTHWTGVCVCVCRLNENRRCDRQLIRSRKTEISDEKVRHNVYEIWIPHSVFD